VAVVLRPRPRFSETRFYGVSVGKSRVSLPPQLTAEKQVYSYAVFNRGPGKLSARVEISPDGTIYATDREEDIPVGEMRVLVSTRFLRFTRLSLVSDSSAIADVTYQARSAG